MNKIGTRIANIHTELLNIIGDCLQYDLSGDQISKIQDKKADCVRAIFALKDTISDFIK